MYQDKGLVCKECGKEFPFTAGEQEFYEAKGLRHQPRRCPDCRSGKGNAAEKAPRPEKKRYKGVCAACGKTAWVPFEPRPEQLVYCSKCYAAMKEEWEENRRR